MMDPLIMTPFGKRAPAVSSSEKPRLTGLPAAMEALEFLTILRKREHPFIAEPTASRVSDGPFSEKGVPVYNNLEKLTELLKQKEEKHPSVSERTLLDEMVESSFRPRNRNATLSEMREATIAQVRAILDAKLFTIEQLDNAYDDPETLRRLRLLGLLSPSASTLLLVHLILWGRSILKLGTEKHWEAFLEKSNKGEIFGCCLMTEEHGGTQVDQLKTTATYDEKTREFVINSPTPDSKKAFIGGGAKNATHGVLFARLILKGKDYGMHPFVIELRRNGENLPGIKTEDMGLKRGLNGVDNAYVSFDNVRISYDALLDHFAEISPEGEYIAKNGNKDPRKLIFTLMSQFVRGRQTIAFNAANSIAFLLSIFTAYPPPLGNTYHKQIVTKLLSQAFALEFAKPVYLGKNVEDHIHASMMKAVASEMGKQVFDYLIFLYGGVRQAAHIYDLLLDFRDDFDATLTFEGVNDALKQLVTRDILKKTLLYGVAFKSTEYSPQELLDKPYYAALLDKIDELKNDITMALMPSGGDEKKALEIWNRSCQIDAIQLAEMYAQMHILMAFHEKAKLLDKEQETSKWTDLFELYAWDICGKYVKELKKPDFKESFYKLSDHLWSFLEAFDMKREWLDALIPAPKQSKPFEEFETGSFKMPAAL